MKKTILVTGCSSGIGAHCARALARDGWRVFATARTEADLRLLDEDGLESLYLDYREPDSIKAAVTDVLERTGGTLDALYNNGAYSQAGAVEDLPMEALRDQFETNFFGWHDLTRRIVPVMRKQGHGRIVQCSSILGLTPLKYRGAYNASKFALEGLTLTMAMELEDAGITVSLIEPGAIRSKIAENAVPYFKRHIDMEASPHRKAYTRQLARLEGGGTKARTKLGPEAVYDVLKHALESDNPRVHYLVTRPAKIAVIAKRVLPHRLLYKLLSSRS